MYIFGGFKGGERTNEVLIYRFEDNKWSSNHEIKYNAGIGDDEYEQPCLRSGHSACIYGTDMYIFGGRDQWNHKLNDLWKLNLETL